MSVGGVNGGFNFNVNPIKSDTTISNTKKSAELEKNIKVDKKLGFNFESTFESKINSRESSFPASIELMKPQSESVSTFKNAPIDLKEMEKSVDKQVVINFLNAAKMN